jgi:hypothetical protein
MIHIDLSRPPPLDVEWAAKFMCCLSVLEPDLPAIHAIQHAVEAYRLCWLLDPLEAADLWLKALHKQGWRVPINWSGAR